MKKRKDGRYCYTVTVSGKKKFFYGNTPKEAIQKAEAFANKKDTVSFSKVADEWFSIYVENLKYNTQSSYKSPCRDCKEYFENTDISEIKASDCVNFFNSLKRKGYATHTIQLRQIVLNQILDYAAEKDYLTVNVSRLVSVPKTHTSVREELTQEQVQKVLSSDFLLPQLMLYTGVRKGEALALTDEDIADGYISITKEVIMHSNKPVVEKTTKTNSGYRKIPIPDILSDKFAGTKGYLFSSDGSSPFSRRQYETYWKKFCDYMGEKITAHQLRHSFSTQMFYAGIDIKTASALMGHSKVDMMLNRYTHLRQLQIDEAKDKLNNLYTSNN